MICSLRSNVPRSLSPRQESRQALTLPADANSEALSLKCLAVIESSLPTSKFQFVLGWLVQGHFEVACQGCVEMWGTAPLRPVSSFQMASGPDQSKLRLAPFESMTTEL